jgi:hypothetical protein
MPVPFDATTIKSWYQTGDKPTQQQYHDWIDTMFYLVSDLQAQITALGASFDALSGFATVFVATPAIGVPTYAGSRGVDTVTSLSTRALDDNTSGIAVRQFRTLRITFEEEFLNTNYTVVAWSTSDRQRALTGGAAAPLATPLPPVQVDKQTTRIDIELERDQTLYLLIFS